MDPHLSRGGPMANVHSAVLSRLLSYSDERAGTIVPDLAASMPEQPDELTYIFHLRDGVRFHDTPFARLAHPTLAGRALLPSDVAYNFERQIAGADSALPFYRAHQFRKVEKVRASGNSVTVKLKQPSAAFLGAMASRHQFIIAAEAIDAGGEANSASALIGTGPFALDWWEPGVAVKVRRNSAWFATNDDPHGIGGGRPYIDGVDAHLSPESDLFARAAFDRKAIDVAAFADPAMLEQTLSTNLEDIAIEEAASGGMLATRFLVDRPPFSDDRVRRAIHLAIDRRQLGDLLYPAFRGEASYALTGPVAPAIDRWALPQEELASLTAYRPERAADLAEARRLWEAALGSMPIDGMAVLFAGVPKPLAEKAAPAVQRMLRDALGLDIVVRVDPSGDAVLSASLRRNAEGATEGTASFTFAFEDSGIDLDDCLFGEFHSGEPGNTYRLQDATLDAQLEKQRSEFDEQERRAIGLDIQNYLLANVNARLDYVAPVMRRVTWGYLRNAPLPTWHGQRQRLADAWLDHAHAAWQGRPA